MELCNIFSKNADPEFVEAAQIAIEQAVDQQISGKTCAPGVK